MKKLCCSGSASRISLLPLIWLLVFQNPLERLWGPFSYIDEAAALVGVFLCAYDIVILRRCRITKQMLRFTIPLCIFVLAGLAGNLIYRYQPLSAVVIDLYTNLKFFFAVLTGYYLFRDADWESVKRQAVLHAKIILVILLCVFLADQILDLFVSEYRYGLKSAQLFYHHPTYLAGALAFLLALLTLFYDRKSIPFLAIAVFLMVFTLRSKSIASAAAYVAMFVFFLLLRRTLKLWHVAILGAACVIIAWPQIRFYFIELSDLSARSILLTTSFLIMKDYFPIGTGFAAYASSEAAKHYSPVYYKYGFHNHFELRDINDLDNALRLIQEHDWLSEVYQEWPELLYQEPYLSDSFWPIIFGQTGVIGTAAFVVLLCLILKKCFALNKRDLYAYVSVLFIFVYLFISSMAEPAFHNSVAISLALVIGMVFRETEGIRTT